MDQHEHPDGRPQHQDGAVDGQSRPPQAEQPNGQPQQPWGQQPQPQAQQPWSPYQPPQPSQQAGVAPQGQQQPYQPQPYGQQQPYQPQGQASPPPTDWQRGAGAPVTPPTPPAQQGASPSAPPAGWQGDHATYLQTVPTAVYQAPSQGGYAAYQQSQTQTPAASTGTSRSTWSLITGVVGLVVSVFVGWGFPLSIAAIVLGFGARRREPQGRGRALTGLVTGFVGLACSVGWLVYSVVVIIGYVST
ncbi:DUF4190 domain-containing protein [Plantibacter cousiniae (nom. nud.)]|uniref:DUF4190 domain-containing protein n=1 Tax=Plantibacter cousiniae (nom. nud.) TaxID=199709 RepID=UPI001D8E2FBE|nr:DUF4190 domain-containing protein [Plantibacter cousiniae]CAH0211205.1 hypothetical protein SRABI02_02207 [Plantibacter cousiniae]